MAKRGAKPKKTKGEMVWVPDYLVSSVKKLKEIDMIGLKERFAELNIESATVCDINIFGVKLLSNMLVYRDHIVVPTASPDQALFGFSIIRVIDGEDLNLADNPFKKTPPYKSLDDAITAAKTEVDEFFEELKSDLDYRSSHLLKYYSDGDRENILKTSLEVDRKDIADAKQALQSIKTEGTVEWADLKLEVGNQYGDGNDS